MGIAEIEALIDYYERHLAGIDSHDRYDTEPPLVLIARDDIEDRWAELSTEQEQRVSRLDDVLIAKRARIAPLLPSTLSRDRRRWWWLLHEGPQVREQGHAA